MGSPSYSRQLRESVASSAGPYGYTLSVWGAGAVCLSVLGKPGLGDVLLFISGAVLAYELVALAAFRSERISRAEAPRPAHVSTVAYWLPAGVAIAAAWAIDRTVGGDVAWAAAGFAATVGYLTLSALQAALGGALHRD